MAGFSVASQLLSILLIAWALLTFDLPRADGGILLF